MAKSFEDLPFSERPDLTPYLIHLTKNTKRADDFSAFDNLVSILKTGEIWGSDKAGFIKGKTPAACFMDVSFASLKYVLNPRDSNPSHPRYEPYGIVVKKPTAVKKGCRPVLYLSDEEVVELKIPDKELWRVVKFEADETGWISWLHEREWRCPGNFSVPPNLYCVLVKNADEAKKLQSRILSHPRSFKVKPRSVVPLSVICQGLPKFPES